MAAYTVRLRPSVRHGLAHLDGPERKTVALVIDALGDDPRPPGVKALQGHRAT